MSGRWPPLKTHNKRFAVMAEKSMKEAASTAADRRQGWVEAILWRHLKPTVQLPLLVLCRPTSTPHT